MTLVNCSQSTNIFTLGIIFKFLLQSLNLWDNKQSNFICKCRDSHFLIGQLVKSLLGGYTKVHNTVLYLDVLKISLTTQTKNISNIFCSMIEPENMKKEKRKSNNEKWIYFIFEILIDWTPDVRLELWTKESGVTNHARFLCSQPKPHIGVSFALPN